MTWRQIWYDSQTGRLRSGWRAVLFVLVATPVAFLAFILLSVPMLATLQGGGLTEFAKLAIYKVLESLAVLLATISVGIWALRTLDRLPGRTLGLAHRGWLKGLLGGVGLGALALALPAVLLVLAGGGAFHWAPVTLQHGGALLVAMVPVVLFAAEEELLFRGYIFQTLLRGAGPLPTLLLTSAAFAALHLTNPQVSLLGVTNVFVVGVLLGMLYLRSGSLWLPIGFHAGWNYAQVALRLPVSGIETPLGSPLSFSTTGPAWLTGGAFGIEGSVIASGILLVFIAVFTYTRYGLPLESAWWEWRSLIITPRAPASWDFTVGSRPYQWKLLTRDNPE